MNNIPRFKRIYIEITNSCNLHCSFCQETKRPVQFMKIEEFGHVLKEIKPYTNYIYLHVKGEPLLHPQFEDILRLCKLYNITVNLTTNATLIHSHIESLLKYPVHQINVSMHSAEDNTCVDMCNYIHNLFEACEIILENTDTEISIRLWNTTDKPFLFGKHNCTIKKHLYVNVAQPFEWPTTDSSYYNDRGFCQGLRNHIAVLCDGTVVPCCLDGNGIMALGNIFTSSLEHILNGSRSQDFIQGFRRKTAVEPLCMHCSFKERFNNKM